MNFDLQIDKLNEKFLKKIGRVKNAIRSFQCIVEHDSRLLAVDSGYLKIECLKRVV